MRTRTLVTTLAAVGSLGLAGLAGAAPGKGPQAEAGDTRADFTPFERFEPLGESAACEPTTTDSFSLPTGFEQEILAEEGDGGSTDLWDMTTQNETGTDAGRYLYRTHETSADGAVSVTDLTTGETELLAQRTDWERFDGLVWTPWGSLLAAEEVTGSSAPDPDVPQAEAGLVYELFVDPEDPTELLAEDPRDAGGADDGIAVRPAVGSRSHEGLRFDKQGRLYGISESSPGGIFRFSPEERGDLSAGRLAALKTADGHAGAGVWIDIPTAEAEVNSQTAAAVRGANGYSRPEDVETGQSTGRDRSNGGNTLYVAVTGTDEVMAIDLSHQRKPFVYDYVGHTAAGGQFDAPASAGDLDAPDNLALDRLGNLAIAEDPGGTAAGGKVRGDDVWMAAEPESKDESGPRRAPASTVQRLASLRDCDAEPSGLYFAMKSTDEFVEDGPLEGLLGSDSLLVHRMHSGQGTIADQLVAVTPDE